MCTLLTKAIKLVNLEFLTLSVACFFETSQIVLWEHHKNFEERVLFLYNDSQVAASLLDILEISASEMWDD